MKWRMFISGWVVLSSLLWATPYAAFGFDTELLKVRLTPKQGELDRETALLQVNAELWQSDQEILAQRHRKAMRVSQSYVADNLQVWVKDTPLERVDRLIVTSAASMPSAEVPDMSPMAVRQSLVGGPENKELALIQRHG